MNIIVKRSILYYIEKYPDAEVALMAWYKVFSNYSFEDFNELKSVFKNASILRNHGVVFNIKGNYYRLIVSINFRTKAAYIIWFGTHSQYDEIDATSIPFDSKILLFKPKKP